MGTKQAPPGWLGSGSRLKINGSNTERNGANGIHQLSLSATLRRMTIEITAAAVGAHRRTIHLKSNQIAVRANAVVIEGVGAVRNLDRCVTGVERTVDKPPDHSRTCKSAEGVPIPAVGVSRPIPTAVVPVPVPPAVAVVIVVLSLMVMASTLVMVMTVMVTIAVMVRLSPGIPRGNDLQTQQADQQNCRIHPKTMH